MRVVLLILVNYCRFGCTLFFVPVDKLNATLQVETSNGLVQGTEKVSYFGDPYFMYQRIPYALPPVGDLRFKSPQPIPKWNNVLDATKSVPCCAGMSLRHLVMSLSFKLTGQEDCLYLNVLTPKNPNKQTAKPRAVMVFFYGGAFLSGCSNIFQPGFLIRQNVILVLPQFRISVFGYLNTEDLESPGNYAMKDQIAVLQWIQSNIKQFGGDPNRVTIIGHSAGATNVNTLILSKRAKNLFHRAALLSGSSLAFWAFQAEPRQVAFDIGVSVGIEVNDTKTLVETLRKVDSIQLQQNQISAILINLLLSLTNGLPFAPGVEVPHEEAVITDYPYNILEKGEFSKIPVMIGITSNETGYFRKLLLLLKPLLVAANISPGLTLAISRNSSIRSIAAKKMWQHFLNTTDLANAAVDDINNLFKDHAYSKPQIKTAQLLSRHCPVYFYRFDYQGLAGSELIKYVAGQAEREYNGSVHSEDLAYLFTYSKIKLNFSETDLLVAEKFSKLYTNFAKTGNPTPTPDPFLDNVIWPGITPEHFPYLNVDEYFEEIYSNFDEKNYRFWESLYDQYADRPYRFY